MPKYKAPPGRGSWRRLPQLVQQRVLTEWRLKKQGMNFRADNPNVCSRAYARMSDDEFAAINACQEWANWRIIPRLVTRIQDQGPWSVIDLGCGQGVSTEVLAWYSPANSHILGFRRQQIDQTWQDAQGQPIADGSITLVNASGIIGHHLSSECVQSLVAELSRVLAFDGWALLDVGPHRGRHELSRLMSAAGFSCQRRARSWWLDPCGQLAFRRSTVAKPSRFKPLTRRGANRDNFNPSLASRNWTQVHCGSHNSVDANNT
jgi:SAM-dependent methyltransferase